MKRQFLLAGMLAIIALLVLCLSGSLPAFAQSKKTSIEWKEASAKDFDSSEELSRRSIYDDWQSPKNMKSKPLVLYFYWPVEDKASTVKETKSQAENTEKMDKVLDSDAVKEAAAPFLCVKVNLRNLMQWGSKGEVLSAKYSVKRAPALVFYDRTGFPQGAISGTTNEATLAEKMKFVASIGSSGSGGDWVTAEAMPFEDEKTLKKRSVFEDWNKARELGEAKPMIFFFYWPTKDKDDKDVDKNARSQAQKTEEMENAFSDSAVSEQLARFYCFKVDLKELKSFGKPGEAYISKYKAKKAPVLVIFDYKGNKLMSVSGKQKSSSLARKLKSAADKSDKLLKR